MYVFMGEMKRWNSCVCCFLRFPGACALPAGTFVSLQTMQTRWLRVQRAKMADRRVNAPTERPVWDWTWSISQVSPAEFFQTSTKL